MMERRAFLWTSLAPLVAGQTAARPLLLGVDTYALRSQGWKLPQMLAFAGAQKLDIIQASQENFESFEEPYLLRMKEEAKRIGVQIEPGFGAISELSKGYNVKRQGEPAAYLTNCIRIAKTLGAGALKVFAGNAADRAAGPVTELIDTSIKNLRSVRSRAVDAGVKIALENHGDLQARELRMLIEEAGPDAAACNFDSGNPAVLAEDPLAALEILAPYIVTSHIRDCAVFEHPRGAMVQWVALGDGVVDLPLFARRFAELCPKASFQLEILTGYPARVIPYLEPDYWRAFPASRAQDFARFVSMARNGRPFTGSMILQGQQVPELKAALKAQERFDLERSLDYCRKTLGIGVKWRQA